MSTCRWLFCLFVLAGIVGCGKKQEEAAAMEAPQAEMPAAAVPAEAPPPAPPPPPAKPALVLTPELESAVVCVRVATATAMQREHVGVLLHPQAVSPPVSAESTQRLLAVLLPTYEEAALRDANSLIKVLRRKFDANGTPYVVLYKGTLVHFDAGTHAALVQFMEDFPYRLESGLTPAKGADAGAEAGYLLQCVYNQQVQSAAAAQLQMSELSRSPKPGTALQGTLEVTLLPAAVKDGAVALAVPEPRRENSEPLTSAPVLTGAGGLAGFGSRMPGQKAWEFRAYAPPAAEVALPQGPYFLPQGVQLSRQGEREFTVTVQGALHDPQKELQVCKVAVQSMPTPELPPVANPREDQPALVPDGPLLLCNLTPDGALFFSQKLPRDVTNSYLRVQVLLVQPGGQVVFHAAPFVISSTMRGAGLYQTVSGLAGQGEAAPPELTEYAAAPPLPTMPTPPSGLPPAPGQGGFPPGSFPPGGYPPNGMRGGYPDRSGMAAQRGFTFKEPPKGPMVETVRKELTTESRILYGVPVCEGREVIFRLAGAPHWKRLSLAEGKWLPLPAEDLSRACVAGNKEALFVLQPATGEIRRYNAATLTLEKTGRLPGGISYQGLAAGCLTEGAPVAVMYDRGALACDPKELTMSAYASPRTTGEVRGADQYHYLASGDGVRVWCHRSKKSSSSSSHVLEYLDPMNGYSTGSSRDDEHSQPTVAATCSWSEYAGIRHPGSPKKSPRQQSGLTSGHKARGALACSPNFFLVTRAASNSAESGATPQCTFFSYYSDEPWATMDVPEAGDVPVAEWKSLSERLWLDPGSLNFVVWHHEQTLTLHTLDKSKVPQPQTPVLLNYPDCFAQRGGSFRFTPVLLGGAAPVVSATEIPEGFTVAAGGSMQWQVPAMAPAQQVVLDLKMATAGQQTPGTCEMKIALELGGEPPVVAVPAVIKSESAEDMLARAAKAGRAVPLRSRLYRSDLAIKAVMPGLDDYLALRLEDESLALFSVRDWKVVGGMLLGNASAAFMAGDAVFIYNSVKMELTRHALPTLAVTHRFVMPRFSKLIGLGVGEAPMGALTLVLEAHIRTVLILDKQTLTPTRWAPYPASALGCRLAQSLDNPLRDGLPIHLPTSSDGRLVSFPHGLLTISPALTMDFEHPEMYPSDAPASDRVFTAGTRYVKGTDPYHTDGRGLSRCGNYFTKPETRNQTTHINLFATDDGRPLLSVASLEIFNIDDGVSPGSVESRPRQVVPMGEKNLIAALSRDGKTMQLVHLDLAATYQGTNPGSAYVTSHPFPIVMAGRTLEYHITLNNPGAVSSYALVNKVPGATINNLGHFTYNAPAKLEKNTQANIAIQIRFKSGETAVHKFPVYAVVVKAEGGK